MSVIIYRVCVTYLALVTSLAAAPCSLQPRYLLFFPLGEAAPTSSKAGTTDRGAMLLDAIAGGWKANGGALLIVGHNDEAELHFTSRLDAARAEAVRAALVQRGIDPAAITTRAEAFNDPMIRAPGPEIQNRYVSVIASAASCNSAPNIVQ